MKLCVGIATKGRPAILHETLKELTRQTSLPAPVFICPADAHSVKTSCLSQLPYKVFVLEIAQGLTAQRNRILDAARSFDIVVFFDDDFFPTPTYLERAAELFEEHPMIVAATGVLIADGIHGPGFTPHHGRALLTQEPPADVDAAIVEYGTYGCNMAVRLSPVYEHHIRFDKSLPLYGWQEDIDFSRQLARFGIIVRAGALSGVHLGTKSGRTSGVKFGYSQVANPIYLIRKGTLSVSFALPILLKNLASNFVRALFPEPNVDRRGRLKGNALAIYDLLRMRLHPTRILSFDNPQIPQR